ncbi:Fic/DOC family protein [compost metagenome]
MKNPAQWSDETYYDPGKYKIFDNHTYRATGKVHHYTQPENVAAEMAQLIQQTNTALAAIDKNPEQHPLLIATAFHLTFLNKIHPFGDGNGRIARIFMNLVLLQNGFPPIFIKEVDKKEYLNCFTEEEKVPGAMLNFMADRLIESLREKKKYLVNHSKND